MRVTQQGGTTTSGVAVADRSFVFTYTNPKGDAPALATAAERLTPPQKVTQSVKLFSVIDPRKNETTFTYWGPTPDSKNRWKLKSWNDRLGNQTAFTHDWVNRTMTTALPMGRTYVYGYDLTGRVTKMTNPKSEVSLLEWTTDNKVSKVTFPTGKTNTLHLQRQRLPHVADQRAQREERAHLRGPQGRRARRALALERAA